ncbi:MAG: IS200/IS605 family transposase [Planctomycetota bacterium]|nr:IS200/IS605 family transposase [Planctomycetota bacterium]
MSYTALKYHVVFSTKDRRRLILPAMLPRLVEYVGGIARQRKASLLAANGPEDHLHLLVAMPADLAVSEFLREVKCVSSSWIHENFPHWHGLGWQDGYAAFTVSQSGVERVQEYIQNQQKHHKTLSFEEELKTMLTRHGIAFDERYVLG